MTLFETVGRFVVEAEQRRLEAHRHGNQLAMDAADETCAEVYRAVRQMVAADRAKECSNVAPAVADTTARALNTTNRLRSD
jgi:hypothetical protein